jgi:hypothetical protein
MVGPGGQGVLLCLEERATGYLLLGLLADRMAEGVRVRALQLLGRPDPHHHGRQRDRIPPVPRD